MPLTAYTEASIRGTITDQTGGVTAAANQVTATHVDTGSRSSV
jgi:hypothetical protein